MKDSHWLSKYAEAKPHLQLYSSLALECLYRKKRHPYWDVETLLDALNQEGESFVLSSLASDDEPSTVALHNALRDALNSLREPFGDQGVFLNMWRDICFQQGWRFPRIQSEGLLFDSKTPSLHRKLNLNRKEEGIDPGRLGLLLSSDGEKLVDFSRTHAIVYDSSSGRHLDDWTSPSSFVAAASIAEDQIAVCLSDGRLKLWDLDLEIQTTIVDFGEPAFGVVACQGAFAVWTESVLAVFNLDGERLWEISGPFTDDSLVVFSQPTGHLICFDGLSIRCWQFDGFDLVSHLVETHDPNHQSMQSLLLDFGHSIQGLRLLDSLNIWSKSTIEQHQSLAPFSRPVAVSRDGSHALSIKDVNLELWKIGSTGSELIASRELDNAWSVDQCEFVSPNGAFVMMIEGDSLVGIDFQQNRSASLPLSPAFHATMGSLHGRCAVWVDLGDRFEVIRFNPD